MTDDEIDKLTHRIIGCAMEVHNQMGNGFQEVIYQRALAIEFTMRNLSFEREMEMNLEYKGHHVGKRRVDFFVEGNVMLEIKAVLLLEGAHKTQAINYCEAYNIADGLLINFGSERLQYNRVFNRKLKSQS
jgi:GxxExxY protein